MHRMVSRPELCEPGAHAQPCVATQVDENPTPSILANMRTALGIWQGNGCWGGGGQEASWRRRDGAAPGMGTGNMRGEGWWR